MQPDLILPPQPDLDKKALHGYKAGLINTKRNQISHYICRNQQGSLFICLACHKFCIIVQVGLWVLEIQFTNGSIFLMIAAFRGPSKPIRRRTHLKFIFLSKFPSHIFFLFKPVCVCPIPIPNFDFSFKPVCVLPIHINSHPKCSKQFKTQYVFFQFISRFFICLSSLSVFFQFISQIFIFLPSRSVFFFKPIMCSSNSYPKSLFFQF